MNGAKKIDSLKKVKGKIEFLIDNFLGKIRFIYLFIYLNSFDLCFYSLNVS